MKIIAYKFAVVVMVENRDQKLLLVKSHNRGWEFPGGFVEKNESIKDAAIREVKEETGINIQLTELLGIEQQIDKGLCIFLFKGYPISGQLLVSTESEDIGYFTVVEALRTITLSHYRDRIIRCLNHNTPYIITIG